MNEILPRIRGAMPALLTPLTPDLKLDRDGLVRLVDYVLAGGVHGMVVLGSSGEFQSIDWDQRRLAVSTAVEAAGGRAPVIAGAGLPNLKATIDQIKASADAGADCCLVTPPYYFPIDQDAIVAWFEALIDASPVPILYYHFPRMTKLSAEPDTIVRMRDAGLAGIKDSGGQITYLQQVLARLGDDPNFRVTVGGEAYFLAALVHGADGSIGPHPNIAPELNVGLFEAFVAGDMDTAAEMQRRAAARAGVMLEGAGSPLARGKAVLEKLGICGRTMAPPMVAATDSEADETWAGVREFIKTPAAVG